jgi:hypothetical protein
MTKSARAKAFLAWSLAALPLAGPAAAVVCTVPGSRPTIQAAVDDGGCTEIVLSAQTYAESVAIPRSLVLHGPAAGGARLAGSLVATGYTVLALSHLAIESGCPDPPLLAKAGAKIEGQAVDVRRSPGLACPGPLFADGFESGNLGAWSTAIPP